jgi:hypothetical protein
LSGHDNRIYVLEDGIWEVKGRFSKAIQDESPLGWEVSDDGIYSVSLLAVSVHFNATILHCLFNFVLGYGD